ncbi:unnamed protein product [Bursaphelenchus okinawaensis]|uniref:Uncharacterized protein n=1 Tax=Bursaphelenchus okinawaensis TaxID=465554 RepID=A0A811KS02_9BILA|nr:unnamed protein product [Bursaphelenchus okinawaensis]CAG9110959.1 unnamed protein product [Bursaphelenchus okinawaensis]
MYVRSGKDEHNRRILYTTGEKLRNKLVKNKVFNKFRTLFLFTLLTVVLAGFGDDFVTCIVNNCQPYYGKPEYKCVPTSSCNGKLYDQDGKFLIDV